MCLYTKNYNPITTTKDRYCYKVVRKDDSSFYYGFDYVKGGTYEVYGVGAEFGGIRNGEKYYTIERGLHSYRYWITAWFKKHSCDVLSLKDDKIVRCLIPKGSLLWKGLNGEQVSNKLIYGV